MKLTHCLCLAHLCKMRIGGMRLVWFCDRYDGMRSKDTSSELPHYTSNELAPLHSSLVEGTCSKGYWKPNLPCHGSHLAKVA
ncbi:hypothetical protein HPP92_010613 [Vanilla planifolia]|uniref:Uncharacterized protein n=1 Tax=Vanilla planifolia TaxID=51239 RepID=A0A835V108_VANPL|nr:hypothetical protein HPP92_010613 [Vanilla planifolia]